MREGARRTAVARRQRMSATQVRTAMLETGQRSIWNAGLTLDLNDSHFDDLIRDAGVPRSSVFRIWQNKADYLVDLYESVTTGEMAGLRESVVDPESFDELDALVDQHHALRSTPEGRRRLLLEVVRAGVASSLERMSTGPNWQTYLQMMISSPVLTDLPEGGRVVAAHLATERTKFLPEIAERYRVLFENSLGLRLMTTSLGYEQFAIAALGVVEGFALRNILALSASSADTSTPSLQEFAAGTFPGPALEGPGATAPWSPAAVAFLGIVDAWFEPVG